MKKSLVLLFTLAVTLFLSSDAFAQRNKKDEDPRLALAVVKALQEGNFTIEMTSASALNGMSADANGYQLKVKDGKATARLPYFGAGSSASAYGSDGDRSIVFEDCPVNLKLDQTKAAKGKYTVSFEAKSGSDNVDVTIRVWTNGSADLTVQPGSRGTMSYVGYLVFE